MNSPSSIEFRETSQRITGLRFLLIVFVVFIHNNYTHGVIAEYEAVGKGFPFVQNEFGRWIQLFFSNGLARCAVPLLFLFSAYFQNIKEEDFFITLKKKFKTLFIPYFIWMGIYCLYYTVGKLLVMQFMPGLVGQPENTVLSWSAQDWLFKLFGYGTEDGLPGFAYHFWFMRDLMILVLISPLLKFLVERIPLGFFFFVGGWYLVAPAVPGISNQALFFYVCGLYWGRYSLPVLESIDKIRWGEAITLFCGSFFINYCRVNPRQDTLYWLMVAAACILVLKFSRVICSHEKILALATTLSGYSFFLYAVHTPVLNEVLKRLWIHFFPMMNTFFSLFEYFGVTFLTVVVGTGVGYIVKKLMPRFYSVITGGR